MGRFGLPIRESNDLDLVELTDLVESHHLFFCVGSGGTV